MGQSQQQITLKFGNTQKRCNIKTTITPFLVHTIKQIEFEWFYKANKEWLDTISIDVKQVVDDIGKEHTMDAVRDLYSTPERAYSVYLNVEDITKERVWKSYKYEIIVSILKKVLLTDNLTDDEKESVATEFAMKEHNFWVQQDASELTKFYTELKKSIE